MEMQSSLRRYQYWVIGILCCIVIGSLLWAMGFSWRTASLLKAGKLESAAVSSQRAVPIVKLFSGLTLHQIPDLEFWRLGLLQVAQAPETKKVVTQNLMSGESSSSAITLRTVANQVITLSNLYQQSWLLARLDVINLEKVAHMEETLRIIRETVLTGDHTWLVVFQNTQELRATGGFTGSYATISLHDGVLEPIEIYDIYQPDGQFTGYVPAPPGVAEYLSSGKGLRLPDANWWPDFPKSAHQMLTFFALGKTNTIDGVIAINLDIVKDILKVTGPVYLPDYEVEVSSENIAEVLRSNRDEFFPGSVAKQHLLASFFTSLKLKIAELSSSQQVAILDVVLANFRTKQIQAFSTNDQLQATLVKLGWSGHQNSQVATQTIPTELYLYPVESNVGINKANQGVKRSWSLDLGQTTSIFRTQFSNQTETDVAYVNYHRLYLLPHTEVKSISYQGTSIETWDEEILTVSNGEQFKQIGFLIGLLPNQTGLLTLELEHPPLDQPTSVVIQKQSGLPPVELDVRHQDQVTRYVLETDLWFRN